MIYMHELDGIGWSFVSGCGGVWFCEWITFVILYLRMDVDEPAFI